MNSLTLTNYGQSLVNSGEVKIKGFCLYTSTTVSTSTENVSTLGTPSFECENAAGTVYNQKECQIKVNDSSNYSYTAKSIVFYVLDSNNVKKAVCFYKHSTNSIIKKTTSDIVSLYLNFNCTSFTNGFSFNTIAISNRTSRSGIDGDAHIYSTISGQDDELSLYSKTYIDTNYYTKTQSDSTFLTSADISNKVDRSELSGYVTTSTTQTVSGSKTFSNSNNYFNGNVIVGTNSSSSNVVLRPAYKKGASLGNSSYPFNNVYANSLNATNVYTPKIAIESTSSAEEEAFLVIKGIESFEPEDPSSDAGSFHVYLSEADSASTLWIGGEIIHDMDSDPSAYMIGITNDSIRIGGFNDGNSTDSTIIIYNTDITLGSSTYVNVQHVMFDNVRLDASGSSISVTGDIIPVSTNNLGSTNSKWSNVYATNFNGLASKATADSSGNTITSTYARYLRTYNYSGSAVSSIPSSPSYSNTPTMLGLADSAGTARYYTGLSAIIANTLRGFSVVGYASAVSSLTRYSSGGIGAVKLLKLARSANAASISTGSLLTDKTLYSCSLISSSSTGQAYFGDSGSTVSGTWCNLTYIPAQGSSSGYVLLLGVRVI